MSEELRIVENKILESRGIALQISKLYTHLRLEGWCDEKLAELRAPLSFSHLSYDRKNLKWILIRFFDLYLTGFVQRDDCCSSIIFDMIALCETDKGRIWANPSSKAVAFYKQNQSCPNSLSVVTVSRSFEIKFHTKQWGEKQRLFWYYINTVIQNIKPNKTANKAENELIKLGSFLALTLMRFAVRKKEQVSRCFNNNKYMENLIHMKLWESQRPYSSPCNACLELCECELTKKLKSTSHIFTILVHEFVLTKNSDYPDPSVAIILNNAVLADTAGNGISIIKLLQDVCIITSLSWEKVKDLTLFNITEKSWETISKFFETQQSVINPQHSFNWARIINDHYFMDLMPKENLYLATVFAAVVAEEHGPGIWNAQWAKKVRLVPHAKIIGQTLYQYSQEQK